MQRTSAELIGPWMKALIMIAIPLLACILSYCLVQSEVYEQHADPPWIKASSQIYLAHNSPCEIVVYGDSTAITGIDPVLLAQTTGLKACNVAQTKGTLVTLGTQGLDMFLHHNQRPKVLLLQFSASNFYRAQSWGDTIGYMEGGIPLLRYYPKRTFVAVAARHPELIFGMMRYAYVSGPVNWWRNRQASTTLTVSPETPVDVHLIRPGAGFTSCEHSEDIDPVFHQPSAAYISWLRSHYGGYADRLIIDVAPTSVCNPHAADLRKSLYGLDNSLSVYPMNAFNEGYVHFTAQGSALLSRQLARQIESSLPQSVASLHYVTGAGH